MLMEATLCPTKTTKSGAPRTKLLSKIQSALGSLGARFVSSASHVQNSHSLSHEAPVSSRESHWGMCGRRSYVHTSSRSVPSLGGRLKGGSLRSFITRCMGALTLSVYLTAL